MNYNDIGKCNKLMMQMWNWNGDSLQLTVFRDPLCRYTEQVVTYRPGCVPNSNKHSHSLLTQFLSGYHCLERNGLVEGEGTEEFEERTTSVSETQKTYVAIIIVISLLSLLMVSIVVAWRRKNVVRQMLNLHILFFSLMNFSIVR